MKLDLTCPVEVQEWELLLDDHAHARAYLHFCNLTDSPLRALYGRVTWIDADSGQRVVNPFSGDRLTVGPRSRFTMPVTASGMGSRVLLEPALERIELADGTVWQADPARLKEWPAPPRLPGRYANVLAAAAGRDAVCCAQETDAGDWLCVCGRWNAKGTDACRRCRRDRADTLDRFSPQAVEALAPDWMPAADIEDPIAAEPFSDAENAPARRRAPLLRRVLMAVLLAAVFALAALGVRVYRYRTTPAAGLMPTSHMTAPDI